MQHFKADQVGASPPEKSEAPTGTNGRGFRDQEAKRCNCAIGSGESEGSAVTLIELHKAGERPQLADLSESVLNAPLSVKRVSLRRCTCPACDTRGAHRYLVTFAYLVAVPGMSGPVASQFEGVVCKRCAKRVGDPTWLSALQERRAPAARDRIQAGYLAAVPPTGGVQ